MTSSRFPGKVLAPFCGRPLITRVVERLQRVPEAASVVLVTSTHESDDPLAGFGASALGVPVFRGHLTNVAARFQACLVAHPCDWFIRICGDSPFIDPELVSHMARLADDGADLVTNLHPRTFPQGQSIEVIRTRTFLGIDAAALEADEQEHATLCFYRTPGEYRIRNVRNVHTAEDLSPLVIDTIDDLKRLEKMVLDESGLPPAFECFSDSQE